MFKKKCHGGLKLLLLLSFFMAFVIFSLDSKVFADDYYYYSDGTLQYWVSGEDTYILPSSGYWSPDMILKRSAIPQYNYSLDDYYIGWGNVSTLLTFMGCRNYDTDLKKYIALGINNIMYQHMLTLGDLVFWYDTTPTTYNGFSKVHLSSLSRSLLWLNDTSKDFSFGSSGDFIEDILYYNWDDSYLVYSAVFSGSGDYTLSALYAPNITSSTTESGDLVKTYSTTKIGTFSSSPSGTTTNLTIMTSYNDYNPICLINSCSWTKVETNPFPAPSIVITPIPTLTSIPSPLPTDVQNIVDGQSNYWGDTDFSGDSQIIAIGSNISESINSFSGEFADNSIVSALEDFERGFYNLLSERDISKLDFRIFWSDIYFSLFLPRPILLIPSGEVNFSELCRDIPALGNVQSTIRVIFNFYFFFNLLTYAYNLILTALGIDSPYLLDNPDNPTENLIMDMDTGVETYYRNYRAPHQVLRHITYVRHKTRR